jgi:hypothetical protein
MRVTLRDQKIGTPGDVVELEDGFVIARKVEILAEDLGGFAVELVTTYRPESGRYEADDLRVTRRDGREVTGEILRTIPVAKILHDGVMKSLHLGRALLNAHVHPPTDLSKAGPTDETLRWASFVYRMAMLSGDAPTQAVADNLKVPRSTAGRWVTRARDRGHLSVRDPRGGRSRS